MDEILEIASKTKPLIDILVDKKEIKIDVPYHVSFDFVLKEIGIGTMEEKDNQYVVARLRLVQSQKGKE